MRVYIVTGTPKDWSRKVSEYLDCFIDETAALKYALAVSNETGGEMIVDVISKEFPDEKKLEFNYPHWGYGKKDIKPDTIKVGDNPFPPYTVGDPPYINHPYNPYDIRYTTTTTADNKETKVWSNKKKGK